MQTAPFTLQKIERSIVWADEPDESGDTPYTDTDDAGAVEPADFREALDALEADCWDSLDARAEEVICYPADSRQDLRTGAYESTTLVIKARRPEWLSRLLGAYEERERFARWQARHGASRTLRP